MEVVVINNLSEIKEKVGNLLTIGQVADILDVHNNTIKNWIYNGKLEGKKVGGQWRISKDSVIKLIS